MTNSGTGWKPICRGNAPPTVCKMEFLNKLCECNY